LQLLQTSLDLAAGGLSLLLRCREPGRAPFGVAVLPGLALERIQIAATPDRRSVAAPKLRLLLWPRPQT
jgi:hypothetical protein